MNRRGALLAVAAVLVLTIITFARIHAVHSLNDQGYFTKYVVFADRILAGNVPRDRLGDLSPLYLWSVVASRAAGMTIPQIRDVQIALLTLAAFLCGLAVWRGVGRAAGVAAFLFVIASRAALVTATELEPETLIVLLISGAIFFLTLRRYAGAGLLLGLAVTARPVAALALILVAIWLALRDRRAAFAFVATALAPIVLVLIVNNALTGHISIMEPGTGLYDGNNPLASGIAGVLPRIVADLDAASSEPDYLHVAYRLVAARDTQDGGNAYWSRKSFAWMRAYPSAAAKLFATKGWLALHNYDIYDLLTTKRKAQELTPWLYVPFGAIAALAIVASLVPSPRGAGRGAGVRGAAILFALSSFAALVLFNVSSRQRDALLPPVAILAAVGVVEIAKLRRVRLAVAIASAVVVAVALTLEGRVQHEDEYAWFASTRATQLLEVARAARARGANDEAVHAAAQASVLRTSERPFVLPAALRKGALDIVANSPRPELRFDAAIALEKAGAWDEAEAVLRTLGDYRPIRENRAVSSVAFYRARAAMHRGRDPKALLDRALEEAQGDPDVLAARWARGGEWNTLDALFDPFTREAAVITALRHNGMPGDNEKAEILKRDLIRRFPDWRRAHDL